MEARWLVESVEQLSVGVEKRKESLYFEPAPPIEMLACIAEQQLLKVRPRLGGLAEKLTSRRPKDEGQLVELV